jgi:Sigma-70, region 4
MASIDSLPHDQRAVLELVLRRGRSYDEIAQLLSIDRAGVRQRALSALDALGPEAGVPAERRALITDYLLGALPPKVTEQVRDRLAQSPGERAWARVVAAELEPIATHPLPDIPAAGETAAAPPAPAPPADVPGAPEPEGHGPIERTPRKKASELFPTLARLGALRPPKPKRPRREREPRRSLGPRPPVEPGRQRPPSRRGGVVVLAAALLIVLAIVLIVTLTGGSSTNPTPASNNPTTPTTASIPTTATTPATGTTASSPPLAQINLNPPSGGSAKGVADVVRSGSTEGLLIVATHLQPNTKTNAYAVWLSNSASDSVLLGFVNPAVTSSGNLRTEGTLPANARHFSKLLVTIETQAKPTSPGTIILEGALPQSKL